MIPLNSDFKDLLSLFNRFNVRYLVVGGYAVMYHTEPRYTKDLDILIGRTESDIAAVASALGEFGFTLSEANLAQLHQPNQMIALGRAPVRIDILNEVMGIDFESAWVNRIGVMIGDAKAWFMSRDDLVVAKRSSGRPQDLLDLSLLEKSAQNGD